MLSASFNLYVPLVNQIMPNRNGLLAPGTDLLGKDRRTRVCERC